MTDLEKTSNSPLISVILNVYNGIQYIEPAVRSILEQSLIDFELIIVDDGSDDGTEIWLQKNSNLDERIRILRQEHRGIPQAHNAALTIARGEFVAKMDADDISLPDRFEKQVAAFRADPELVLVGSEVEMIDEEGRPLGYRKHPYDSKLIRRHLLLGEGGTLTHPAVMYSKSKALEVGGYDENFPVGSDLDLFLKLTDLGNAINLEEILLHWRQHPSSVNRTKSETWQKIRQKAIRNAIERIGVRRYADELVPLPEVFSFPDTPGALAEHALIEWRLATAFHYGKLMLREPSERFRGFSIIMTAVIRKLRAMLS